MSAATLASPAITAFAGAVRAALSDLPVDEVDDLTDGLEADLTEQLAEADTVELGDPVAYAEELRTAAGLPVRERSDAGTVTWQRVVDAIGAAPRQFASTARELVDAHPSLRQLRDFVIALRPLWWLFRAIFVTALVVNVANPGWWSPINPLTVSVGIMMLVLSVQFGRGRWLPFAWMRRLLLALNLILIVIAPFVIARGVTGINDRTFATSYSEVQSLTDTSGLRMNGGEVSNIYAYDASGAPLSNVQLFDQHGNPLNVVSDSAAGYGNENSSGDVTVPSQLVAGRLGWNVYPLAHVPSTEIDDNGTLKESATPSPAELPFAAANPLLASPLGAGREATATPAPTPTPSPTP